MVPQPISPAGNPGRSRAEPRPYVSFAPWQTLDAVCTWKANPDIQGAGEGPPGFHGEGPGLVATAMARDATVSVLSSKR